MISLYFFSKGFKTNIEKDIVGDTSGDFKYLLIGILQGNRSEEQEIDAALVEQDVKELHKVGTVTNSKNICEV